MAGDDYFGGFGGGNVKQATPSPEIRQGCKSAPEPEDLLGNTGPTRNETFYDKVLYYLLVDRGAGNTWFHGDNVVSFAWYSTGLHRRVCCTYCLLSGCSVGTSSQMRSYVLAMDLRYRSPPCCLDSRLEGLAANLSPRPQLPRTCVISTKRGERKKPSRVPQICCQTTQITMLHAVTPRNARHLITSLTPRDA